MRITQAATASLALCLTKIVVWPVSGQPSAPTTDIVKSNQTLTVEHKPRESHAQGSRHPPGDGVDSTENVNPDPKSQIYPKRSDSDAPYSMSERELRSKIYFPETFNASSGKQPVILIPGTAVMAGSTYRANLGPLLDKSDFANPLWVNIPDASFDDAQESSEYVAYAMNYIQTSTGRKPAVVAWGQGSLNVQWAFKYWPSTRDAVTDLVALGPDFHGTTVAFPGCDSILSILGCAPSVYQHMYGSQFVRTLRADGGDSAYVPTTSIFSSADQIVQPQSGSKASALINDARGAEASNIEVRAACPNTPAGASVTHEGLLYNALAFALLKDALAHEGPGRLERIDKKVCGNPAAGKLSAAQIEATDDVLDDATMDVLLYFNKVREEPDIKTYAKK
ncbi:alpha/beta-hydrolase [Colletotrichum zoysiae]|uniref:Alpha/beta-hydrolase n=1 Tax=Colletotrichum zoysiae TaxID=1216348 RepID=A0AAD9LY77_9PEZI|nr:alpha/beta-hydrolase [Colletotrichum zoysiae]